MSFTLAASGGYRSSFLDGFPWLDHLFGTRHDGPPHTCLSLRQIHSPIVRLAAECRNGVEGDAILTGEKGVWVGVKTADCVPILLADPEHHVAAAVHAGWRGTVAGVAQATVQRMGREFGSRPEALVAAIGPAIGCCCYEVGPEVGSLFRTIFPDRDDLTRRARIDLAEANHRLLFHAGIPERQIDTAAICTSCLAGELHSWRRDRESAGRMVSGVCILN